MLPSECIDLSIHCFLLVDLVLWMFILKNFIGLLQSLTSSAPNVAYNQLSHMIPISC